MQSTASRHAYKVPISGVPGMVTGLITNMRAEMRYKVSALWPFTAVTKGGHGENTAGPLPAAAARCQTRLPQCAAGRGSQGLGATADPLPPPSAASTEA